ncbi:hypothetical protein M422DRAFT_269049 [Sphaerobolus stellatus SS14]|uniref:Uncharacterized protein n=1 Tax=Sphaerobolus stellatus (strain SS14) TaxID=990650 RepID=A0A0C9TIV1_SPHS4|nr:hypothetical protein M422DRAFT_269049 [Sphaerobolus stellatus SS14]
MVLRRKGNIIHVDDPVLTGPVPRTCAAPFRAEPTVSSLASHALATEVGEYVAGEIRAEMSSEVPSYVPAVPTAYLWDGPYQQAGGTSGGGYPA